ncbi:MAG: hemerythrin domain-containing protein [Rhodospirillales bacterium]|nr:hemerythrin domain-containing protein [Rhodospirillales bacterium]
MPQTHIARALHEEHMATLALLARLEALLGQHPPAAPPPAAAPMVAALLEDFAAAVGREVATHFAFEERALFPLLDEPDLTAELAAEHLVLLAAARRLALGADEARAVGFGEEAWRAFHATAGELCSALTAHVEKEEMGLLPALDATLDAETDASLAIDYAAEH